MKAAERLRTLWKRLGRAGQLFAAVLAVWLVLLVVAPLSALQAVFRLTATVLGLFIGLRLARRALKKAIWRLRNRLCVTYVFIAVVPVVLILVLWGVGAWIAVSQVAVYLVSAELERRTSSLRSAAQWLARATPGNREDSLAFMAPYYRDRFPGLEVLVSDNTQHRYPPDASITEPAGWGEAGGVVLKDGRLFSWGRGVSNRARVTILAPLNSELLSRMLPGLGEVDYLDPIEVEEAGSKPRVRLKIGRSQFSTRGREGSRGRFVPPPVSAADLEVWWFTVTPVAIWESAGEMQEVVLAVRTRPSAVWRAVTSRTVAALSLLPTLFVSVALLFLVVELISLFIGVSLTRTITNAVHNLYEGTRRVREADFTHRIAVKGDDQLAELCVSFNQMTANLERLVAVAKEKERLQAELEIAREVQNQLYPRFVPSLRTLRLTAHCTPARIVSGDYYDYQSLSDTTLALAIGDVAGKGISAALLMATVESSVRTQLHACVEAAATAGNGGRRQRFSTSGLVSQLNQQLYAHTSPEKYATFYFGLYDDETGLLTYTNAGHLPPILVRAGAQIPLEVNGMVVGAFPFAEYGESQIQLQSGDLLLCYTDGITEPENEYGEMFGEERLLDVVLRHAGAGNEEILAAIVETVKQWTASPDLADDMTLLLARRQ